MTTHHLPPELVEELAAASKGVDPFVIGFIAAAQGYLAKSALERGVDLATVEIASAKHTIAVLTNPPELAAYTAAAEPFIAHARRVAMKEIADKAEAIGKHWLSSMFTKDSILNAWNDLVGFVSDQAKPQEGTPDAVPAPTAPGGAS